MTIAREVTLVNKYGMHVRPAGATAKDADATAALNAVFAKANAQLRRASKKRQEVRK